MRPDMLAISIEQKDGKAYIRCPYNADFVRRIRLMGGKWDADSRRWVVCSDAVDEDTVRSNLPYTKGGYATGQKSKNAVRVARCRNNKRAKSQKIEGEI